MQPICRPLLAIVGAGDRCFSNAPVNEVEVQASSTRFRGEAMTRPSFLQYLLWNAFHICCNGS